MTTASVFTVLAGLVAVVAAAIYFFGIPAQTKRSMERGALNAMGENKMSYMAKDQISKIPASDQEDVKNLKKGLGNALGGAVNNPIGEAGGRAAKQAWGSVHEFSKAAMDRANTMRRKSLGIEEPARNDEGNEPKPVTFRPVSR